MSQLDDLFKQAREIPVNYSLEETLSTLESNAGVRFSGSSRIGKWLLTNKLWIMISLIMAVIMGFMLIPENKKTQVQNIDEVVFKTQPEGELKITERSVEHQPKQSIQEELEREAFDIGLERLPLQKLIPKRKEVKMPVFQSYHHYRDTDEEYIPTLTEEQKQANERQKQKMLKALGKKDKKEYAYLPSSSIRIFGKERSIQSFYMRTTEVTNLEYRTFLFDLIIQGRKEDFLKARPDQKNWSTLTTDTLNPMEEIYFSHEAYNNYPVVNITSEGAQMFCQWLSESYENSDYVRKYGVIERARLPYYEEWYLAASNAGQDSVFPWGTLFTMNEDSCYLANFMPKPGRLYDDGGFYTVKVDSYNPNWYGIYNLVGNATEMVVTSEGIQHAGGGWMSPEDEIRLDNPKHLQKREGSYPTDGFRFVFTYLSPSHTTGN